MATGNASGAHVKRSMHDSIHPMVPSPPHISTCVTRLFPRQRQFFFDNKNARLATGMGFVSVKNLQKTNV